MWNLAPSFPAFLLLFLNALQTLPILYSSDLVMVVWLDSGVTRKGKTFVELFACLELVGSD